ncbi:unnamed protein product [Effrenium voratum]|nr:unnamed protein product [Effrenium voratum]
MQWRLCVAAAAVLLALHALRRLEEDVIPKPWALESLEQSGTAPEHAPEAPVPSQDLTRVPSHAELEKAKWRPPDFGQVPVLDDAIWQASLDGCAQNSTLHAFLQRLLQNQTITIQVYGGSMTYGMGCCAPYSCDRWVDCSWGAQLQSALEQLRPGRVRLEHRARRGCNLPCALPEVVLAQRGSFRAPDLIILDFGQNGWGGSPENLEEFIRVCHLFMPQTLLLIIWNKDMTNLDPSKGDIKNLQSCRALSGHYGIPLLNFQAAMEEYTRQGGNWSQLWPRVLPEEHHPPWRTHAYFTDMLAYWFNRQLGSSESSLQLAPVLRQPDDLNVDQAWIPPLYNVKLEKIQVCLFPLTSHVAREPNGSPTRSPEGRWQLYEDRRDKPGWITMEPSSDKLRFEVNFSRKARVVIQYLRSYANIGTAEVEIEGSWLWQHDGKRTCRAGRAGVSERRRSGGTASP